MDRQQSAPSIILFSRTLVGYESNVKDCEHEVELVDIDFW